MRSDCRRVLTCTGVLLAIFLVSRLHSSVRPVEIAAEDWAGIREAYEEGRHAVVSADAAGTLEARNPAQGWRTEFDGRGFLTQPADGAWSWGLELKGYGNVEGKRVNIVGHVAVSTEKDRVVYRWSDEIQEWFVNERRGLLQGWTVAREPIGGGETLRLDLAVRGG